MATSRTGTPCVFLLDGVEFDVFKTLDDKVVVFHDEETERLTGVKGNITEMTWDEVSPLGHPETR